MRTKPNMAEPDAPESVGQDTGFSYYMIRIQRPGPVRPATLSGVIERLGTGEKRFFADGAQLLDRLGYRYAYEMSHDPRFQNRSWDEVEADMRRDYGTWSQQHGYRHTDSDWDRMRNQLREWWDTDRQAQRAA